MLLADATALIALGHVGRIDLLQHYDAPVVIGPAVEAEVIRSRDQIAAARAAGWLQVEHPDQYQVSTARQRLRLDAGEAEIIVLASMLTSREDSILVDERRAFGLLLEPSERNTTQANLIGLAQALQRVEDSGRLPSASTLMQAMLDSGIYAWAANVRQFYEAWCRRYGKAPLPAVRRTV